MTELVYHTDESAEGGISPFDTAIREIVADEDVLIACPYITLDYLRPVLREAGSWRLLTDLEAWLGNYSARERETIREFVTRHHERIHDVRNLHAKAVIGETDALVGSAKLTWAGLQARDELAVRFDEPERIAELREWFDGVWEESDPVELDEVDTYIRAATPVSSNARGGGTSISSNSRRVSASLVVEQNEKPSMSERSEGAIQESHEKLVEQVRKGPGREWIDRNLNLLDELLQTVDVPEDDQRMVTSLTKDGKINTTINSRLVLGIHPSQRKTTFILGDTADRLPKLIAHATETWRFEDQNRDSEPHLLKFADGLEQVEDSQFRRDWLSAALNEVTQGERSPYRRHHEPAVYQAAVDHDYRERVLSEAFGT